MAYHSFLSHVLPFLARGTSTASPLRPDGAHPRTGRGLGVRRGPRARLGFGVAVLVLALGCGDSGGKKLGIADGASGGDSQALSVTPEAGGMLQLKTGARLKIPAGAVDQPLEVTFKRPPDSEALSLVKSVEARQKIASAPYVVTPHGKEFNLEVEVVLPVEKGRDPKNIKVAWLEDEKDTNWKVIATPEIADGKATFRVTHFSVFVLLESQPASDGPGPGTGGGDIASRFLQRLEACGLLSKTGDVAPIVAYTPDEECFFNCMLSAECDTLHALWCSDALDSAPVEACVNECLGGTFTCADGDSVEALYRCDLVEDCADGSDELDCPQERVFTCDDGLTVIFTDEVCDTYIDCEDGADEADCEGKFFECADGSGAIPLDYVCDFEVDCADGSDEPERCAKVACGV